MHIEHIAIWVHDLEATKAFYVKYFGCVAGSKYNNIKKGFQSYFLTFESGTRLELMRRGGMPKRPSLVGDYLGLAHFAICVGNEQDVDYLTKQLETDGVVILNGPRRTGDGYYESLVLDPEGNQVEITADRP